MRLERHDRVTNQPLLVERLAASKRQVFGVPLYRLRGVVERLVPSKCRLYLQLHIKTLPKRDLATRKLPENFPVLRPWAIFSIKLARCTARQSGPSALTDVVA